MSGRGAFLALLVALAIGWPMWTTGELIVFTDTKNYLKGGEAIWDRIENVVAAAPGPRAPEDGGYRVATSEDPARVSEPAVNTKDRAVIARGFTYSFAAYAVHNLASLQALAVAQTWATVFCAFGLVPSAALASPLVLAAGLLWLIVLTPLPWVAGMLIPDLMAAIPILFAAVLAVRWSYLGSAQRIVLTVIASLAASTHYGLMPLAAGAVTVALVVRWIAVARPGFGAIAAGLMVVLLAPLINLTVSTTALDGPSAAPLRLPILLARSIEDGPARWYLQDVCPDADLALCEMMGDDIPDNAGTFLWSGRGVNNATPDEMARVRAQEWQVLGRAFLRYPVAQTRSLFSNAAVQAVDFDVSRLRTVRQIGPDFDLVRAEGSTLRLVHAALHPLIVPATVIGTLGLAAAALALGPGRHHAAAFAVVLVGLAGNALIFGGLSAPAERYQARVIWCLGAVLLIMVAELASRHRTVRRAYDAA